MNKDRGFTLIELLAVIIVLGIVLVITVPVVKDITKDAKQKGLEKQISVVLESAKNWAIQNTDVLPENSRFILVKIDTLKKEGFLENKTITNPVDKSEMNGCAEISYNSNFNQYEYKYNGKCEQERQLFELATTSSTLGVNTVADCATDGTECEPSTAFAIKVNTEETYKFRVLSDKDNVVTLIMDSNLYTEENPKNINVEWLSQEHYEEAGGPSWDDYIDNNHYGPITALEALKTRTSTWTNLDEYSYELNYGPICAEIYGQCYGNKTAQKDAKYSGEYVQNVRTRLPKQSEISVFEDENMHLPSWLYQNLSATGDDNTYGYWLSDAYFEHPQYAFAVVTEVLEVNGYVVAPDVNDTNYGIRPVIELSKATPIY